jgi:DNA-binding NarL/FixJ family response regulator
MTSLPSTPVRILHCDDSPAVQALLLEMMRGHEGVDVIEQVNSHAAVMTRAAALQPDLVVLDLDAKRDEQVVARLRETCSARILVLSGDSDLADDPLVMQADGFVSKSVGLAAMTQAVLSAA